MKRIIVVAAIALCVTLLGTAFADRAALTGLWEENASARQLKFSHTYHVGEAGIACVDCHKAATTSLASSDDLRATHESCTTCHEEQIGNTCGFCHVNPDSIEPVPPARREIAFPHAKHVTMAGVECATCHPGLEKVEHAGPANMPPMTTCNKCHNDTKAPNTCESCHTQVATLIPGDHLTGSFRKDHRQLTRVGGLETQCSTCHTQDFCADCHSSAGLIDVGMTDLMSDPAPRPTALRSSQTIRPQAAHPVNYRFFHGIDARSKESDCQTCHSTQEFCATCHEAGGNITQGYFKPAWHQVPDFTRLGVGSGGGKHADAARRDIENCASCHDIEGADPTCITCHVDPDGIKHTNPKTHTGGFPQGEEGVWHHDAGASCYVCHTDMNAHPGGRRGVGFCGYCHH
jgi:hypothetical protein